jgi:hypothetical protein
VLIVGGGGKDTLTGSTGADLADVEGPAGKLTLSADSSSILV